MLPEQRLCPRRLDLYWLRVGGVDGPAFAFHVYIDQSCVSGIFVSRVDADVYHRMVGQYPKSLRRLRILGVVVVMANSSAAFDESQQLPHDNVDNA